jgi:hypothetical protein
MRNREPSVVGSWKVVDDNSHDVFLATYTGGPSEGAVNFTSPNSTTTLSHGQWKRTGECTFADTDTALLLGADGKASATITFQADIEVAHGGNDATFAFDFSVKSLDGSSVTNGSSTAKGTRINVVPRITG